VPALKTPAGACALSGGESFVWILINLVARTSTATVPLRLAAGEPVHWSLRGPPRGGAWVSARPVMRAECWSPYVNSAMFAVALTALSWCLARPAVRLAEPRLRPTPLDARAWRRDRSTPRATHSPSSNARHFQYHKEGVDRYRATPRTLQPGQVLMRQRDAGSTVHCG